MATLKDIALACGVSTATVSYVVNDGPRTVLPQTRERIQQVIKELGYHPNAHARGLRGKRTDTVGVVFPHVTLPFENAYFGPILEGVVAETTERHLATMLFTGLTWEEAEQSGPKLCDGRCDGFLLIAPHRRSRLISYLAEREIPFVSVGTHPENADVWSADSDNIEGARQATDHLIQLGHRRIAMISNSRFSTSGDERVEGFRLAMASAGLPVDESLITPDPEMVGPIKDHIRQLLTRKDRPTAMFCGGDGVALDVLVTAKEVGLSVPQDLSVVGFDDVFFSAHTTPALTTVRQPMREIGAMAVNLLYRRIEAGPGGPETFLSDIELIRRASTAPPPGSG